MTKKLLKIFLFALPLSLLFFSGCVWQKTITPPPTGTSTPVASAEPNLDTSTWKTFTDDEFGFSFKYPEAWNISNEFDQDYIKQFDFVSPEKNITMSVSIQRYKNSPEVQPKEGDSVLLKSDLSRIKNENESSTSSIHQDGFDISKNIDYDVPGGGIYMAAKFFADKNMIALSVDLPVSLPADPYWTEEKRKAISKEIEKIQNNEGSEEIKYRMKVFDMILSTLTKK